MKKIFIFGLFLYLFSTGAAFAVFSDKVMAPPDEVWKAVVGAIKPYGTRKADAKRKKTETRWAYDSVVRSRGLLKKVAKKTYQRRSRMKIDVQDDVGDSILRVEGIFQESSGDSAVLNWRNVKPQDSDYDLEERMFMTILRQMEKNRRWGQLTQIKR